ncbi:MAG TPA: SNF2-related protein [Gemmatimonadales bacterium]|nr:SNF2-related protein [Gemmatimonadales bacterium]
MSTAYHAAYWAHSLTLQGEAGTIGAIGRSLGSARVDLNPHQVDAALFALRSPLSKGALLADEVGLGKTIEAGLVLAQRWAERRRHLLLIVPATLRRQWQQELRDKFGLPSQIIDAKVYRQMVKEGHTDPLDRTDTILICTYHYAASRADWFQRVPWDLVVLDEAHRLRNVHQPSNRMANAIRTALEGRQKLLLTATPLQNSLLELFGLVSVIDPHVFGDLASFRERYLRPTLQEGVRNAELKARLSHVATRTLRRQVTEYVRFTNRIPITEEFYASDAEQELYASLSAWLQREHLEALPAGQRTLLTLVLRKLLASSPIAVAGTLERMVERLEPLVRQELQTGSEPQSEGEAEQGDADLLVDQDDLEDLDELVDEFEEDLAEPSHPLPVAAVPMVEKARRLAKELDELRGFIRQAHSITHDAKAQALLTALKTAFRETAALGGARKAVIFTESRRTQRYLVDLLEGSGYSGEVIAISGSSTDPASREIYQRWLARHAGEGGTTSSRGADIKAAIVEEFRDNATIMVATESAGEGVNLQFCSLVVNYDLPWNPQRVEQRIGRCHRYGQQHDVVVLNFLNLRNAADKRVYELLSQKFRLFEGVFGASDEVLGALESGVDIERRIAAVYQECRTLEEIQAGFDQLQQELEAQIAARMGETRDAVLDHFDEEVQQRLQIHRDGAKDMLDARQRWLLDLTRWELGPEAHFDVSNPRFRNAGGVSEAGWYNLDWRDAEQRGEHFYHQEHPLAELIISTALREDLPAVGMTFSLQGGVRIAALESFVGRSGWLTCLRLALTAIDLEEHLVVVAVTDSGEAMPPDVAHRLFSLEATTTPESTPPPPSLHRAAESAVTHVVDSSAARRDRWLTEESEKLERWAEDLRAGVERELKDLDREISEARRASLAAVTLEERLDAQRQLQTLNRARNRKRAQMFEAQDAIDERRDKMISDLEQAIRATHRVTEVFHVRWTIE